MEQSPQQSFFFARPLAPGCEALRDFFLENGLHESPSLAKADLVVHGRFLRQEYLPNQFWVILQEEDTHEDHEGLFYTTIPDDETAAVSVFKQLRRSFGVWGKYQQLKDELVVPKTYLEIFSRQIQVQLKGMSGLSNILKEGYLSDLQREKYADYISGNANRLQNFFANLWEYYQYRHHKRSLKIQPVRLRDFLSELHERFQRILNSQGKEDVDFELSVSKGIPIEFEIRTDKHRLIIILSNLLDNAVNYTNAGRIIWKAELTGEHLEVGVENIISEKEAGDQEKLGIGLLIGHYNAEIIHGKLDVKQKENETRAVLKFPVDIST